MSDTSQSQSQFEIQLNGRPQRMAAGTSLAELLDALGVPRRGVAVELDGALVPAGRLDQVVPTAGQRLEVVRLVGGG